jgi:hypothetical protein
MKIIARNSDFRKLKKMDSNLSSKDILKLIRPYVSKYGLAHVKKLLKEYIVKAIFVDEIYCIPLKGTLVGCVNLDPKGIATVALGKNFSIYDKVMTLVHELGHAVIYFYESKDRHDQIKLQKLINESNLSKVQKIHVEELSLDYIVDSLMYKKSKLICNIIRGCSMNNNFVGKLPNIFDYGQLVKKVIEIYNENPYFPQRKLIKWK